MRNLCIDFGNSSVKIGIFENALPVDVQKFKTLSLPDLKEILHNYQIQNCIVSSVTEDDNQIKDFLYSQNVNFISLDSSLKLPFKNLYKTPQTLGKDRLAAVAGAWALCPDTDLLVIDAGTAVTYDFINSSGEYLGGNISLGLEMRAKALNYYTAKLPLVEVEEDLEDLLGDDTISALKKGVGMGMLFEIQGYIDFLKVKYPKLSVFLTGGSSVYFERKLKSPIFVNSNLVLSGLNRILELNV